MSVLFIQFRAAQMARGLVAARQCDERVRALELILFRRCSTVYQRISQKMSVSATVIWDNTREIGNSAARYPLRFCPVCSRISFVTRECLKKKKGRKKRSECLKKKRKKDPRVRRGNAGGGGKNVVPRGNIEEETGGFRWMAVDDDDLWRFLAANLSNR